MAGSRWTLPVMLVTLLAETGSALGQVGQLDTTFGDSGLVHLPVLSVIGAEVMDLVIRPDGMILMVGVQDQAHYLVQVDEDGVPDLSFGVGGTTTISVDPLSNGARAVALQDDGKFVTLGYAGAQACIARFTINGDLDSTFGTNGVVLHDQDQSSLLTRGDILVEPDDGILVLFQEDGKVVVLRLDPSGQSDTAFGSGGIVQYDFGPDQEYGAEMVLRPDGRLLVLAYADSSPSGTMFAFQLLPDGTIDASFGSGGLISRVATVGSNLRLQSDGSVLITGLDSWGLIALKFDYSGSYDIGFGNSGYALITVPGGDLFGCGGTVVGPDGSIHIGGYMSDGGIGTFAVAGFVADGSPDTSYCGIGACELCMSEYANGAGGRAMALHPNHYLYMCGAGYGSFFDPLLMRFDAGFGVGMADLDQGMLLPFPSPAIDQLSIPLQHLGSGPFLIALIDMSGRPVAEMLIGPAAQELLEIPIPATIPSGMYTLRIDRSDCIVTTRVVIAR